MPRTYPKDPRRSSPAHRRPPGPTKRPPPKRPVAIEPPSARRRSHAPQTHAAYALTVPGLEPLAAAEIAGAGARIDDTLTHIDKRDGIVLFSASDLAPVLRCSLVEDVFAVVLDIPTPDHRSAPKLLARALERPALDAAILIHHAVRPRRDARTYKTVARVAGRHPFRREDLGAAFASRLHTLLPRWHVAEGTATIELWVHVLGGRTIAGIRLSGDELARRRYERSHLPASLKPTVARALALLSDPRPGDVVLDPMCGAGTILRERAEAGRATRILGGDIDATALAAARLTAGRQAALARWDAASLPLRAASIDALITNPPYGRQHQATPGIERLYARTMREVARVLRPGGRCVVVTGEPAALTKSIPNTMGVRSKLRLLLRGLPVTAFVIIKR